MDHIICLNQIDVDEIGVIAFHVIFILFIKQ